MKYNIITSNLKAEIWFMLFFAVILFGGCSGSDDNSEQEQGELISILQKNKWISRDASCGFGEYDHTWVDLESTTLYFTTSNTGIIYWSQKDYDSDLGNSHNTDYVPFKYSISGNQIEVQSDYDINYLSYSNGILSDNSGVYQSYPMDKGDYDLIKEISPKTGKCGEELSYLYNPKTHGLSIFGSGDMDDYTSNNQPWHDLYIEEVMIEAGCTSVGKNAFTNVQHVTDVNLPSSLISIGDNAFAGTLISEVTIPPSLKIIGASAFASCKYLKKVILDDNIEEIKEYAFWGSNISSNTLVMPKNLKKVGDMAFSSWKVTTGTLKLNENLETIGNAVFNGIKGTISIPNSVKSIGNLAFDGSFNKIVVGTGVEYIAPNAFSSSASTGTFYVNLGVPLEMEGYILCGDLSEYDVQQKWTLYVPKGSKKAYSYNTYWNKFKLISEDTSLTSGNGTPSEDDDDYLVPKYDYKNLSYKIDGKTYKMILVDDGYLPPFYMMQTELPPDGYFQIGDEVLGTINKNGDNGIIKSEFKTFIDKIRAATGIGFRLPTKAEWLYAAKDGKLSKEYTFSGSNTISDVAWYKNNSSGKVHTIAQKNPNELGFYDMSGNYAELCSDMANEDIYYFEGYLCGGNWSQTSEECKATSVKNKPKSGKIPGTVLNNKGAIDARTTTVRLVYSIPKK